jgi:hypothetical protein
LAKIAYTGKEKEIATNSHESLRYQPNTRPLTYAVWGDKNFVKTLSNFHSPVILRGGMRRKKRNPHTKRREREFSDADCPQQQKTYHCSTYHEIDKGNGAEAKYDISTESHLHALYNSMFVPTRIFIIIYIFNQKYLYFRACKNCTVCGINA